MSVVLDASAVLALLRREVGWERVAASMMGAAISTANYAEVATAYAAIGHSREAIDAMLAELRMTVVPVDRELALDAAMLRPATRAAGLGLGDRLCLALAARLDRPAFTADRVWLRIAYDLGLKVELFR